ncbi:MAG TPA: hypothetical protein VEL76_30580, partial [Gemmataceae bacterium]|nr:hypothetical protein [Gemmataceae bacterium]
MTSPHGLPSILRTKLASLNRRIRLLQALRGGGLLVLAVVVLCGGLFLADLLLALSPQALRIAAAAILGVVALVTVFGLIVPLCRRIDLAALAALIEAQYPDLGERLTTTVELAETRDAWHGSRALIELLIEETEHRARPLDFTRAFPARLAGWMALAAVVAVLAAGLPALLWGNKYADFGNRLVGAWSPAPAATPSSPAFTFQVTPADTFAAKGRSLSLLVLVHPQTGSPATACNLAYTDSANKTVRTRMPAEPALLPALAAGLVAVAPANGLPLSPAANLLSRVRPGTRAFSYQIERLTGDLPFHIEVGEARSDTYKITAVEPVELVASSPTLTIDAPAYASKAVHPTQTLAPGSTPFAYEYGSIRLDCRFTRPAMRASLEIAPRSQDGRTTFLGASWRLPMPLQGDRQQASYEMPALHRGVYDVRLILEAEYGITTVHNIEALTIQHDEPPAFTRKPELAGVHATEVRRDWIVGADATGGQFNPVRGGLVADRAREVAPDDTLKLKITIEDTLGVDK